MTADSIAELIGRDKVKLSIGTQFIGSYEKITVEHAINDHGYFSIRLRSEIFEKEHGHTIDRSKQLLGEPVVITFGEDSHFSGIITTIEKDNKNGLDNYIVLKGKSHTCYLEGGKTLQSWTDKTLHTIVRDIADQAGIEAKINPNFKDIIDFEVQYDQDHMSFLRYLSAKYKENLLYDGVLLLFGEIEAGTPVGIEYGADIHSLKLKVNVRATQSRQYSYTAISDETHNAGSKGEVEGLNELGEFTFKKSQKFHRIKPQTFSSAYVKNKANIDREASRSEAEKASRGHMIKAKSNKLGIGLGSCIKVTSGHVLGSSMGEKIINEKSYGDYLITSITHVARGTNEYRNSFEAIPAGVKVLPSPDVEPVRATPQLAQVTQNSDEQGQGRIKVKFHWMTGSMESPWIRLMSPDAGKSDKHGEIRGNLVIPEVGDQVMVGFEHNDPCRPFVMGSMYNGNNIAAGREDRNSLISRAGSRLVMDDKLGSLFFSDHGKASTFYDGLGNAVTKINVDNTVSTGNNSVFNTGSHQSIRVGAKIDAPPTATFDMDAGGNIILEGKTSITLKVGESSITITEKEIKTLIAKGNIVTEATEGENKMIAKSLDVTSKTTCSVKSTSTMEIKGSEVEINKG